MSEQFTEVTDLGDVLMVNTFYVLPAPLDVVIGLNHRTEHPRDVVTTISTQDELFEAFGSPQR